jgi:hypothetical protein
MAASCLSATLHFSLYESNFHRMAARGRTEYRVEALGKGQRAHTSIGKLLLAYLDDAGLKPRVSSDSLGTGRRSASSASYHHS